MGRRTRKPIFLCVERTLVFYGSYSQLGSLTVRVGFPRLPDKERFDSSYILSTYFSQTLVDTSVTGTVPR